MSNHSSSQHNYSKKKHAYFNKPKALIRIAKKKLENLTNLNQNKIEKYFTKLAIYKKFYNYMKKKSVEDIVSLGLAKTSQVYKF